MELPVQEKLPGSDGITEDFFLEESAFPIMIELRRLAGVWQSEKIGVKRSLDNYIDEFVAEQMGASWRGHISSILRGFDALQPILFIDGWDELGSLGEEFRNKLLGFMQQHKRVKVVVTSRPYGEARPSGSEGFEILDIQPLSDEDIMRLAKRFFELSCKDDEISIPRFIERFSIALDRSPEALSLVRTALLLTMMLMISKSSPLPDKRHLLYQKCIDTLLNAVPDRRQEEGALVGHNQWRPEDSEERLRVVTNLAFHIQEQGYEKTGRGAIVRTREELISFLPGAWSSTERESFLNWLLGATGLMVDRADESMAFTHLSFQEFLAAWFLHTTVEGDMDRARVLATFAKFEGWWETLRLWIALVNGQHPAKLEGVLEQLFVDTKSCSLVAAIFADGCGPEASFQRWFPIYLTQLKKPWSTQVSWASLAWTSSRQHVRKEWMVKSVADVAADQSWRHWSLLRGWLSALGIDGNIPLPHPGSLARILIEAQYGSGPIAQRIAVGRVLSSGVPLWQVDSWETLLLMVWPSRRRMTGHLLQALAVLGYDRDMLVSFVRDRPELTEPFPDKVLVAASDLEPRDYRLHITHDAAMALAVNVPIDWQLQEPLSSLLTGVSVEEFNLNWGNYMRGNSTGSWLERNGVEKQSTATLLNA